MKKIRIHWLAYLNGVLGFLMLMVITPKIFEFLAIPTAGVLPWVYMALVALLWMGFCFWLARVSMRLYRYLIIGIVAFLLVLWLYDLVDGLFFTSQSAFKYQSALLDTAKRFLLSLSLIGITVENFRASRKTSQTNTFTTQSS